ncbi:MAG: hypothetical protein LVQ95_00660 [Candidatus Micrarchaeales archaeon]|nr:hypothetical protein [Candidatus Micrarchaeales archaeon]
MPGKLGVTTVGVLLETYEHLLRPDVDAANSFADLRANAYHSKKQGNIDSAERETNRAVLRQAVVRELASRGLPPETPISDGIGDEISRRVTPNPDRSVAIAEAPAIVDVLLTIELRKGAAAGAVVEGHGYAAKRV